MKTMTKILAAAVAATLVGIAAPAQAKLTDAEAARLGADLTPMGAEKAGNKDGTCLLYTSPSPRDGLLSRMPSSA